MESRNVWSHAISGAVEDVGRNLFARTQPSSQGVYILDHSKHYQSYQTTITLQI
jgi:hypothetical protein